eukprot:3857073-Rhodomonas_salina.2
MIQLPISLPKLSAKQIKDGEVETYRFSIRKLLNVSYNEPTTLTDIGLTMTTVEKVKQTLLNLWRRVPTSAVLPDPDENEDVESGGSSTPDAPTGQFSDEQRNEIWRVLALQMLEGYEELAHVDMLEPNPENRNQAMKNNSL